MQPDVLLPAVIGVGSINNFPLDATENSHYVVGFYVLSLFPFRGILLGNPRHAPVPEHFVALPDLLRVSSSV